MALRYQEWKDGKAGDQVSVQRGAKDSPSLTSYLPSLGQHGRGQEVIEKKALRRCHIKILFINNYLVLTAAWYVAQRKHFVHCDMWYQVRGGKVHQKAKRWAFLRLLPIK